MKKRLLFFFLSGIFFLVVFFFVAGIRGSDQFWYFNEFSNFLKTGIISSDYIYPYFLENGYPLDSQPPIHNCYIQCYLFYPAFLILGVEKGFFIANAICAILSALIASKIILRFTQDDNYARFSLFLVLFSPLVFFYSANMLIEIFLMFCVSVTSYIWLIYYDKKTLSWGLFAFFVSAFCVLIYPIFIAQSIFILGHIIYRNRNRRMYYSYMGLVLLIPFFMFIEKVFLPSQAGILRLEGILTAHHACDMAQYYSLFGGFDSFKDWFLYRGTSLIGDVIGNPFALFSFSCMIFLYICSLVLTLKKHGDTLFCFIMQSAIVLPLFLIFFAHQYQFRYFVIHFTIFIPTFFLLVGYLKKFVSSKYLFALLSIACICTDCAIIKYMRDCLDNSNERSKQWAKYISKDKRVLNDTFLDAIYLNDRQVLCLQSHIYDVDFSKLGIDFKGKTLISKKAIDGNKLKGVMGVSLVKTFTVDDKQQQLIYVYKLN